MFVFLPRVCVVRLLYLCSCNILFNVQICIVYLFIFRNFSVRAVKLFFFYCCSFRRLLSYTEIQLERYHDRKTTFDMLLNKTEFPNHFARRREVFHVPLTTFGRTTVLHFFYCVCIIIIIITLARGAIVGKLWCNKIFLFLNKLNRFPGFPTGQTNAILRLG